LVIKKIYEKSEPNSKGAHQALLDSIKYCLPGNCRPIILADAILIHLALKRLK